MKESMNRKTGFLPTIAVLGTGLLIGLLSTAAPAAQQRSPVCNALVSVANDLYLVSPSGAVLTRFTSDGTAKVEVALAPDGKRVAYVRESAFNNTHYWVANAEGKQIPFPIYTAKDEAHVVAHYAALGALMGLYWNSNHVLRLNKHISPWNSRFEFHRIGNGLSGGRMIGRAAYGYGCAMRRHRHTVACVWGGFVADLVTIEGKNILHARNLFYIRAFPDKTPIATFTLTRGQSTMTPGSPSFEVKVVRFYKNDIVLLITPPNGVWTEPSVSDSGNDYARAWWQGQSYGFSAALVDKSTGLVRINMIKGLSMSQRTWFSNAIAWLPHGRGLLLIRRRRSPAGTWLNLLRPERYGGRDRKSRHKTPQWRLAASVPIPVDRSIRHLRFVTPNMLLLETYDEPRAFVELPVRIDHAPGGTRWTMTVGAAHRLPSTVAVSMNGKTIPAPVLDWSCPAHTHRY